MPYLAFAANFLWVLVLGLLGSSVPAILADLGIGYTRLLIFFCVAPDSGFSAWLAEYFRLSGYGQRRSTEELIRQATRVRNLSGIELVGLTRTSHKPDLSLSLPGMG